MGDTYTVCKNFPDEIIGKYLYEGKGEPFILLTNDDTGLFQPHMTNPIKIRNYEQVHNSPLKF